jgi:mycothiol synthase
MRAIIESQMVGELVPVRVDPMTADRSFWKRFHALRRTRHDEERPGDPFQPDDDCEVRMKKPNPYDFHHYFEVSRDGVMLSWFFGESATPKNPEYATNKHLFWADAYVRPEHRREGIGSLWLPLITQLMREFGCTKVGMYTTLESGHGFMKALGAQPKLTEIESRLKLADVDWDMVKRWAEDGPRRSPGTRLEVYDGRIPEELWPDFANQRSALLNTMPFEHLDIGDIVVTPERMRDWYERAELTGEVSHDMLTREPDGTISGMTDVSWAPYRRTLIQQQFTGVLPSARGRGIGKWIKAAMLLHIRDLHPDAEWIVTENARSNEPMLYINRALGFKPHRTSIEYQMTLDQLESKLRPS